MADKTKMVTPQKWSYVNLPYSGNKRETKKESQIEHQLPSMSKAKVHQLECVCYFHGIDLTLISLQLKSKGSTK